MSARTVVLPPNYILDMAFRPPSSLENKEVFDWIVTQRKARKEIRIPAPNDNAERVALILASPTLGFILLAVDQGIEEFYPEAEPVIQRRNGS